MSKKKKIELRQREIDDTEREGREWFGSFPEAMEKEDAMEVGSNPTEEPSRKVPAVVDVKSASVREADALSSDRTEDEKPSLDDVVVGDAPVDEQEFLTDSGGLSVAEDGLIDITEFQQHPLNANRYVPEAFAQLVRDVKKQGGPTCRILVSIKPDGGIVVLSGWHNAKACITAGIKHVAQADIEVADVQGLADEVRILHTRNRHGVVDPLAMGKQFATLRAAGMSLFKIGKCVGEKKSQVQKMLDRYDLSEIVSSRYDSRHGKLVTVLPYKALSIVKNCQENEQSTCLQAMASPTALLKEESADSPLIDEASARWSDSALTESECMAVANLIDGTGTAQDYVEALTALLGQPRKMPGRPKTPEPEASAAGLEEKPLETAGSSEIPSGATDASSSCDEVEVSDLEPPLGIPSESPDGDEAGNGPAEPHGVEELPTPEVPPQTGTPEDSQNVEEAPSVGDDDIEGDDQDYEDENQSKAGEVAKLISKAAEAVKEASSALADLDSDSLPNDDFAAAIDNFREAVKHYSVAWKSLKKTGSKVGFPQAQEKSAP